MLGCLIINVNVVFFPFCSENVRGTPTDVTRSVGSSGISEIPDSEVGDDTKMDNELEDDNDDDDDDDDGC